MQVGMHTGIIQGTMAHLARGLSYKVATNTLRRAPASLSPHRHPYYQRAGWWAMDCVRGV